MIDVITVMSLSRKISSESGLSDELKPRVAAGGAPKSSPMLFREILKKINLYIP